MDKADTRQAEVVTAEPVVANEHMREVRAPPGPLGVSFHANDTSHRVAGGWLSQKKCSLKSRPTSYGHSFAFLA